jgi:voltage-gated potassium channel
VDDSVERMRRRFQWPAIVAALLVIPQIALARSESGSAAWWAGVVLNVVIWLVFAAELTAILWVASDRWRWMVEHPLEPLIVLLTPPIMPASLQAARLLRLLRLIRLLRLAQVVRQLSSGQAVRFAALVAVLTALGGGAAFASAEGKHVSTWDGVWWAVSTMTTVGYGDLYPHTTEGRAIAMAVMLVGIGFVAILTAAVAQRFVEQRVSEDVQEAEGALAATEAEVLTEIRAIRQRLERLETTLGRRSGGPDGEI